MAKDPLDKKTRDLVPQKYVATYTFVDSNRKLRNGRAVTEAKDADEARLAVASDLKERYGLGNFRVNRVTLW